MEENVFTLHCFVSQLFENNVFQLGFCAKIQMKHIHDLLSNVNEMHKELKLNVGSTWISCNYAEQA